jgi:hypothetical protein
MNQRDATKPAVAILSATDYTGRFVVADLLRREITPIAIARTCAFWVTLQFLMIAACVTTPSRAEELPGTVVTYPENLEWKAVGPLDANGKGIFTSLLYGTLEKKGPTNFLMRYSAGVKAPPHIHSGDYYAVVVSGNFRHFLHSEEEHKVLTAGATWFQKSKVVHEDSCIGPEDCILDIFWPQGFDVEFTQHKGR